MNAVSRLPRSLPLVLAAGLAGVWLLPVSTAWDLAPDLGHAWAAPVLMAYLWWERWAERPTVADNSGAPGLLVGTLVLVAAAVELPLRLLLTPFPLWPVLLAAFTFLLAGIALAGAWFLGGRAGLRWVGGPLILLVSTLPVPSLAENAIIIPLRTGMATIAAEISNLIGHPAVAMGTSVRLASIWVGIDEACGGIRSLQACVMIGLFFGEWYRFGWARRGALLAAAVGAALLGNFCRVLLLSLLANASQRAVEQAHDVAGWFAMGLSLALTGWLACHWAGYRWPEQKKANQTTASARGFLSAGPPRDRRPPTPAVSRPVRWLAVLIGLLVCNEGATRWWFGHRPPQADAGLRWTAILPTSTPSFQAQPLGESAQTTLRPDHFVAGRWRTASDTLVSAYYIEWLHGQVARSVPFLHNPTVCLPYAGCELVETLPPLAVPIAAGNVPFFAYKFRRAGEEMLVAFTIWDNSRGRPLERPGGFRSWRRWLAAQWAEVAEARQHQPAQLLTLTVPWSEKARDLSVTLLQQLITPSDHP